MVWDGSEEPGVLVFGLFPPEATMAPAFPHDRWPSETAVRHATLGGDGWQVWEWAVQLDRWPTGAGWRAAVEAALSALLDDGAEIAWLGMEGRFCDPPHLFDPASMPGGVLAVARPGDALDCRVDPDEPLRTPGPRGDARPAGRGAPGCRRGRLAPAVVLAQNTGTSISSPSRRAPAVVAVSGRTRKCWVMAWTSRRRRCRGLSS